ncbi:phage tail family protein [Tetragenococcus halophilus]|uniref:phage tail family protein n=1 Tax=Tetragenococcus halophilus TaxID=51669 RepID=UPI00209AE50F|nr:phage tail family protein [Tetragenococcus halophilus]MCO8294912.1 phage tail protein [Tetragenococcus halophilus]
MAFKGITFNGLHSYKDLGLLIEEKEIGNPEKEKALVKVPFSDVEYDFSELYGDQNMSTRTLSYTFNVYDAKHETIDRMIHLKIQALNHFMNVNKMIELYDDDYPNWHFLAEVRNAPSFSEIRNLGELTIEFEAYKFMIGNEIEGNDIWDIFDFDFDVAQTTKVNIDTFRQVFLINNSPTVVSPTIKASSDFVVEFNSVTYIVEKGWSSDPDFRLYKRLNVLNVTGEGTIEFSWNKEMI